MAIKLIAGLGNIGAEYEATRHNAGFWLVDALAREHGVAFKNERAFHGAVAKCGTAWLLKPSTFMNRSGQAVQALATFYKILPDEILVVHDELDLPPGGVKMKKGGGHAGHNGLRDIQARLATADFWRLRIGIGHPRELQMDQEVIDFVLKRPSREHQDLIDEAMGKALAVMSHAIAGELEVAMMKLHSKRTSKDASIDTPAHAPVDAAREAEKRARKEAQKEAKKEAHKEAHKEAQKQSAETSPKETPAQ
jgi:peptidyl-tRNA hydrolase, PTH1 family